MKSLLVPYLCLLLGTSGYAQSEEPTINQTIKDWITLRIGLVIDGGDHVPSTPYVLLQRLDAERIILSSGEDFSAASLPIARTMITTDTAQELIDRALEFHARAEKETGEKARIRALPQAEQDAILKKSGFGMYASYLCIEFLTSKKRYFYQNDFSDSATTAAEFRNFIEQQTHARK